jgi:hypothetical protein
LAVAEAAPCAGALALGFAGFACEPVAVAGFNSSECAGLDFAPKGTAKNTSPTMQCKNLGGIVVPFGAVVPII